jgi:hypothetical protein
MRYDPTTLIARARAEAFEEAADLAYEWGALVTAFYARALADKERAKIPTRDNRITDCCDIEDDGFITVWPAIDGGLDG